MSTPKNGDIRDRIPPKTQRGGNMPDLTEIFPSENAQSISINDVMSRLTKSQRERLVSGYDLKSFARVFEDSELMSTVDSFLEHGMNISETARNMYMHRNTLMYRLNKIRDETGLDIRMFNMAVTFEILRYLYKLK